MNRFVSVLMAAGLAASGTVALCGCDEEPVAPQPQPPTPTTQSEAQSPSAPDNQGATTGPVTQGGGSALGSAKRSATGLADRIDQQQRDLLREMGEEPPPPPDDDE